MISQLWLLNSSLLGIFLMGVFLSNALRVEAPRFVPMRIPTALSVEDKPLVASRPKIAIEKIYHDDMFGTFVSKEEVPTKHSLISPIPEFTPPAPAAAPVLPTYDFVPPLDITIKGVIIAEDDDRCVVMIEDETKKESMYHLGDKIKDAQIIKIARDRVVFLRGANGQLETCYLRKTDPLTQTDQENRWKYMVRMVQPGNYEIDPLSFKEEFDSLGNFLERTSIAGAVYQKGVPIGLKVGSLDKGDIGEALGLQQGDVIISINDKPMSQVQDRMSVYESIVQAKTGDTITAVVSRGGKQQIMHYKLASISRAKPMPFGVKIAEPEAKKPEEGFAMSKEQERATLMREFKEKHQSHDQQEAISKIRQRLLENLKSRVKDNRVREN